MISQVYQTSFRQSSGVGFKSVSPKLSPKKVIFTPCSPSVESHRHDLSFDSESDEENDYSLHLDDMSQKETSLDTISERRGHSYSLHQPSLHNILQEVNKDGYTPENQTKIEQKIQRIGRRVSESNTVKLTEKNKINIIQPKKSASSFQLFMSEVEMASLSNIEEITNFYDYTLDCFKLMKKINGNDKLIHKCKPISFPFDNEIGFGKKRLAVFDLDETLVHANIKDIDSSEHIIDIVLPNRKKGKIGLNVRPNLEKALDLIQQKYLIVVYTASHQSYADSILDFIDPNQTYFQYRLYRNHCTSVKHEGKEIYIKDLSIFKNISLDDIIIIDNSALSFTYHLDNGLPILPYYDAKKENELIFLAYYLNFVYTFEDLREANRKYVKLDHYKELAMIDDDCSSLDDESISEDEESTTTRGELYNKLKGNLENLKLQFIGDFLN